MATGERRLGSSTRRGMTVLGKIPAVPKPINLPSQRLENRGLDPSVEIVPRGTFSWGTGRSPPTTTSAWGNAGLASSPPASAGAWNIASTMSDSSSTTIAGLGHNASQPLSAGGTRPSSAGNAQSLATSTSSNRTWGGAAKLEEQVQMSRFNFTTVDFPTLGSEKSPNLRPQQDTTSLRRPTSADARNEWHSAHTGTSLNRPTSADASKDRKHVHPGVVPADRPTSADATLKDKERHQSDTMLPTFPLSGDDNPSNNQRNISYTGVVGHGPAGPGPGAYLPLKDNYNFHPPFVQGGMFSRGSHGFSVGPVMYPIASHYDPFGNRLPPSNMENRPGIYGGYLAPGVDHFTGSGVYQSHYPQHGPSEHISCGALRVGPQPYEAIMIPEPPVSSERRDALELRDQVFEQQMAGWAGRNLVHAVSPLNSMDNHTPISVVASGTELQKQDLKVTRWVREIEDSGWVSTHQDETTSGLYKSEASSVMCKPFKLQEAIPQGSSLEGSSEHRHTESARAGHAGDRSHSLNSKSSAMVSSQPPAPEQVDKLTDTSFVVESSSSFPRPGKYEIPVKRKEAAGRGSLKSGRDSQPPGSALGAGTSNDKQKLGEVANKEHWASDWVTVPTLVERGGFLGQAPEMSRVMISSEGPEVIQEELASQTSQSVEEDREPRASHSKGPLGMVSGLNVANQRLEDTTQGDQQSRLKYDDDSTDGFVDSSKSAHARKKSAASRRSLKKDGLLSLLSRDIEGATCASDKLLLNASERNASDGSSASAQKPNVDIPSGVEGTNAAVQMQSHSHLEHKASVQHTVPTHGCGSSLSQAEHRTLLVPPPVEEGQALNDNLPHRKTKRNMYAVKRMHQSRHETHDKHNANEGLVWAPRKAPTIGEDVKEEAHPSSEKVGSKDHMVCMRQNQSTESHKYAEQVQQMQSAASAPQEQGQMQQPSVAGCRKEADERQHHQAAEINSGNKRLSTSHVHKECEKLTKPRQLPTSGDENLRMETASDLEQRGSLEVETNVRVKEFVPAPRKSKDASTIYVPRPARHLQWLCQEEEQVLHQAQRHLPKRERVGSKHAEVFGAPVNELGKNEDGKTLKHQEVSNHKVLGGERELPRLEMVEEDQKASNSNKQKLAREHEMLKKQSAAGMHQDRSTATAREEHGRPESQSRSTSTTQSSPIKSEMQIYVPKAGRKQQQEIVASVGEGQKQVQVSHKDSWPEEKLQQSEENSQSSSIDKREGMESSTKSARQKFQRQNSTTRHHLQLRSSDSDEQASSSLDGTGSKSASKPKSSAISDPGGIRNDSKVNTAPHFSKNKKEIKYYIPKPQQQQYLPQGDQGHATLPQERSVKVSRIGPSKKREEIERYTPKPARQQTAIGSQVDNEGNSGVDSGELEQQRDEHDKACEHHTKGQILSVRSHKAARSEMIDDLEEANERLEHPKDAVLTDCGPKLRRQGGIEESMSAVEDSATQIHNIHLIKLREPIIKRQYIYQPVTQQLSASKVEQRDPHVVNLDHGQNRYGRHDGPTRRGRKCGHEHNYRDADPII